MNVAGCKLGERVDWKSRSSVHVIGIEPHRRATFEVQSYQRDTSGKFDYNSRQMYGMSHCVLHVVYFGVELIQIPDKLLHHGIHAYACTLNVRPLAVLRSFSSASGLALRRTVECLAAGPCEEHQYLTYPGGSLRSSCASWSG